MNLQQRSRRMKNLLFVFVFFCGLLSLSAFGSKSIKDVKENNNLQIKSETRIEGKEITHYKFKSVKYEKKLLIF